MGDSSEAAVTLGQAPVEPRQRYRALMTCVGFAAVTAMAAPVANAHWANIPAFFPAYQMVTAFCYALTALLLFGDYRQGARPSTLVLGAGSVWTALVLVAQLLSVPGTVAPGRLIGGDQTTIHLWMWWHIGPPVFGLLFAAIEKWSPARIDDEHRSQVVALLTLAATAFSFFAVLVGVTTFHDALFVLNHGADFSPIVSTGVGPGVTVLSAVAAVAVWYVTRGRTILALWLVVSLIALVFDNLVTMIGGQRDSAGWYIGRLEALASASMLLMAYLNHMHAVSRQAAQATAALKSELDVRAKIEEALHAQQKLDSLGQLTGGVAHDFGNILQMLQNELELIRRKTSDDFVKTRVESASRATARGLKLIKQLLTFAKRQPLHFDTVDLNARIRDVGEMVHASLGSVKLQLELDPQLWPVVTDESELDSAVLNLIMNARDAMAAGGTLTISTKNVSGRHVASGRDFVEVAFLDEGIGMPPEVVARAWEPFFTTKPAGKGTGLGLATVYGFVTQSGGTANLKSTPNVGTTITLLLPKGMPSSFHGDPSEPGNAEKVVPISRAAQHPKG